MDAIFKNEYVRDKNTHREVMKNWYFKRFPMILIHILCGFYFLLGLIILFVDPFVFYNAGFVYLLLALYELFMFASYFGSVRTAAARDAEISGGVEYLCLAEAFDGEVRYSALKNENKIGYENIRYAYLTKNYIVLLTKARMMYIFKKDSFTKGSADEFVNFLKAKGIKVKK